MLAKWFYNFKIGRTVTALSMLDDHILKDIGIHRSNIRSHAYEVFKDEKPKDFKDPLEELHSQFVKAGY
tara:strand:- start:193 stop:399 length:207 start_codon:yes stop_codon:yes gene_type:complete